MKVCNSRTDDDNYMCYRKYKCRSCGKVLTSTEEVTETYSTMEKMYRAQHLREMQRKMQTEREGEE